MEFQAGLSTFAVPQTYPVPEEIAGMEAVY